MASSKIKSPRHNIGTEKNITNSLPYTCESDGYIHILCHPSSAVNAYVIFKGNATYRANSFSGFEEHQEFSVSKGEVIRFISSDNCTYVITFKSIIG